MYSYMEATGFTRTTDNMEAFLVTSDDAHLVSTPVSNENGTFLASSPNPRARVVAALTVLHEAEYVRSYAHAW